MAQGFGPAFMAWFDKKVDNLTSGTREAVVDAGKDIARLTEQRIEQMDRIDTTNMIRSVDTEVLRDSKDEIEVRAGYHDTPYYTVFQELGTKRIQATYALTDAAEEVLPDLERKISKVVRDA